MWNIVEPQEAGEGPPLVAEIRRHALDDGPGIRSIVFFKGCPLNCAWCHNPESLSPVASLGHDPVACIGCRDCSRQCRSGAVWFEGPQRWYDPARCRLCQACLAGCPAGALRRVGRAWPREALVQRLLQDDLFFRHSGGGVTFSGGEPTLFLGYLTGVAELLRRRAPGIHLLLETCGHYPGEQLEAGLLPLLDQIYFDLKLADGELHRQFTGRGNRLILANLKRLAQVAPAKLQVRVPLVPQLTATRENLEQLARLLRQIGHPRVILLPYNPLGLDKRCGAGLSRGWEVRRFMTTLELQGCRETMAQAGIQVG